MIKPMQIILTPINEHIASFSYYDGIKYAKENGLNQSSKITQDTFIVTCGEVMCLVGENDFTDIVREI